MKRRLAMLGAALLAATASVVAVAAAPAQAATGFYVSNGRLYDANGQDFVMRGINHPFVWFQSQNSSFANMKRAGANTVRVVLDQGITTGQVNTVVSQCKANRLVCVLEIHSTTGWAAGNGKITLSQAADAWLRVKSAFIGQERYVIINIGNEPYASGTDTGWISQTNTAISKLRAGGVTHTLIADAPAWGQDNNRLMLNNAASILSRDPLRNVVFSVHMYSIYSQAATVNSYINYFADNRLPLIVGEWGHALHGSPVAWTTIMSATRSRSIGWLAWSWSGNGGTDAPLDMTNNFNPNSLTTWGNNVINGTNGLRATSREASVYSGTTNPPPTSNPTNPPPANGSGNTVRGVGSSRCLDVVGGATGNGARPEIWDCNGSNNQRWVFNSNGTIRGVASGRCLDVANGATANGSVVNLWDCTGGTNQQWTFTSNGSIRGVGSGRCLDVTSASTANGALITLWDCTGSANQRWTRS